MPTLWVGFIDDIFVIWSHSKEKFLDFFNQLNAYHPTIKYTYEISNQSVLFLDINIHKGKSFAQSYILDIVPHFKPTNQLQYLHFHSCHTPCTFKGLILGEAIHMLRGSSDPITYAESIEIIKKALIARSYPIKLMNKTLRITDKDRPKLLQQRSSRNFSQVQEMQI